MIPQAAPGIVIDLAGGTGYYLAVILKRLPDRLGLCLDLSAPALRRAARAHPRAAAVRADAWRSLPVASGAASTVVSVFGPRNAAEVARVMTQAACCWSPPPPPDTSTNCVRPWGLVGIDPHKAQRQRAALTGFEPLGTHTFTDRLTLPHADLVRLVGMGPTAAHVPRDIITARTGRLPEPCSVTVAVHVTTYTRWRRPPMTASPSRRGLAAGASRRSSTGGRVTSR